MTKQPSTAASGTGSDLWDLVANDYRGTVLTPFADRESTLRFISCFAREAIPGNVLDAGCGNGYLLEALLSGMKLLQKPFALDFSRQMISNAAQRLGSSVNFIQAQLQAVPCVDNYFDVVFAINSLLSDNRGFREAGLSELHRLLVSGGRACFVFPALESYWEQLHVAREKCVADGMDEQQAIWQVYEGINERSFDPIGGYVTMEHVSLRIKLYTHWEIEQLLGGERFTDIVINKFVYPKELCLRQGLLCSGEGLFDWLVTARKQ